MRTLPIEENQEYIQEAIEEAKKSPCLRSKCGSIIVKDGAIIGRGFNSPPNNKDLETCRKDSLPKDFKSDKTCCLHAEQRAILDALKNNSNKLKGSTLFFIRLDLNNNILYAGEPYCTICSKMALDVKIKEFVLYHKDNLTAYDTEEYNELSFKH